MRLPFRLARRIGRPADVRGEEAAGSDAEALRAEPHGEAGMVEEVPSDGKIGGDLDAERPEPVRRPDAGALQDGRAVVDAGAEHDLVAERRLALPGPVDIDDALRPVAGEHAGGRHGSRSGR